MNKRRPPSREQEPIQQQARAGQVSKQRKRPQNELKKNRPGPGMDPLAMLDHRYLWHPFTQMRDWLKQEPIVIIRGKGAVLQDSYGRKYLDANSSIWTSL